MSVAKFIGKKKRAVLIISNFIKEKPEPEPDKDQSNSENILAVIFIEITPLFSFSNRAETIKQNSSPTHQAIYKP